MAYGEFWAFQIIGISVGAGSVQVIIVAAVLGGDISAIDRRLGVRWRVVLLAELLTSPVGLVSAVELRLCGAPS